ncbi:aminoacyl-tRNA hydrolase [Halochromatium salexigens]|uniref:Peptidyl-tRNA hydrolase n=1 Tax=Halochromatium salexigens TaxID=49447 RepID=A0AAJ0XG50_HALSE|nr:aminoacyl-tRNA hydrolase [Halochromatium salexigens]MBK5930375.1 aminoacyl-tRNA hydrolase [Halochromatium salexigens]
MEEQGIQLIVGLGNPGPQYAGTRHNAGYWLVDRIVERAGVELRPDAKFQGLLARVSGDGGDLRLLKPTTFMNHSGRALAAVCRYFDIRPEAVLIAYDELDLPVGSVKLKLGGGHGGHNGIRDSMAALGSRDFWRLRIGIGHPGAKEQVIGYVLSRPSRVDMDAILEVVDQAEGCLPELLAGEYQRVMNRLHARP